MKTPTALLLVLFTGLLSMGCAGTASSRAPAKTLPVSLVGAWHGKVQFKNGAFADLKDFEFLYVFNAGGTMTESSNYDSVPPVAPAYGAWRQTGPRQFEARYVFYATKPPASFDEIAKGGGWMPAGHGVLNETITLAADGQTYRSVLRYDAYDPAGKATETGSTADVVATRIGF